MPANIRRQGGRLLLQRLSTLPGPFPGDRADYFRDSIRIVFP